MRWVRMVINVFVQSTYFYIVWIHLCVKSYAICSLDRTTMEFCCGRRDITWVIGIYLVCILYQQQISDHGDYPIMAIYHTAYRHGILKTMVFDRKIPHCLFLCSSLGLG